jgi:Leucine-rich repeat (LRR) protein
MIESFLHSTPVIDKSNNFKLLEKSGDEDRIENRKVFCDYNGVKWDMKTTCFVTQESFKMPNNYSITSYRFSGTESQKEKATAVYFELSSKVDFVPFEIFDTFPRLDSIAFTKCEIPILENKLFAGQDFEQIKELRLNEDKIRFIENGTFVDLKKMTKIDLTNNKIRSINKETFAHNENLEEAILTGNEIKLIHPETFINKKYEVYVVMFGNKCFAGEVFNVKEDLKPCYDNWKKAYGLFEEGKNNLYCLTHRPNVMKFFLFVMKSIILWRIFQHIIKGCLKFGQLNS